MLADANALLGWLVVLLAAIDLTNSPVMPYLPLPYPAFVRFEVVSSAAGRRPPARIRPAPRARGVFWLLLGCRMLEGRRRLALATIAMLMVIDGLRGECRLWQRVLWN